MAKRPSGREAQAVLREEHWRSIESSGEMLTAEETAALPASIRSALLGVVRPEGTRLPRFQVSLNGSNNAAIRPAWPALRTLLAPAEWSEENLLMWTLSPNAYLDGDSPASEIQNHPEDVTPRLRYAVHRAIPYTKAGWTD